MQIQKTALYEYHKSLGAKFVPFAGYEMPVQYTSGIIDEHKLTRSSAGMFDVSHMGQLSIEGKEELAIELEKIIPIDLKKIKLNQSKYSFQNPLKQTYRHKKVLSKYLGVKDSHIKTVISFVGNVQFKTELPSNVLQSGLGSYIKQFREVVLSESEIVRICGLLKKTKFKIKFKIFWNCFSIFFNNCIFIYFICYE